MKYEKLPLLHTDHSSVCVIYTLQNTSDHTRKPIPPYFHVLAFLTLCKLMTVFQLTWISAHM